MADARVHTVTCPGCNGGGVICVGFSGLECDGNAPILETCEDCEGSGRVQAFDNVDDLIASLSDETKVQS